MIKLETLKIKDTTLSHNKDNRIMNTVENNVITYDKNSPKF